MPTTDGSAATPSEAEWNAAYDEAMQWRDWQECDQLLDLRETLPWYTERKPSVLEWASDFATRLLARSDRG